MADVPTVEISVLVTLAVQSLYFVTLKLPLQLHRSIANRILLQQREESSYSLYKNAMNEMHDAQFLFREWRAGVETEIERNEGQPANRLYFRESLPRLTDTLGKLKGLVSAQDVHYIAGPVSEYVTLFEQARNLTKSFISFREASCTQLVLELSDMDLLISAISARFKQLEHEGDLLQAKFRAELDLAESEVNDLHRRRVASAALISFVLAGAVFRLSGHFLGQTAIRGWIQLLLEGLAAILALGAGEAMLRAFLRFSLKGAESSQLRRSTERPTGDHA